MTDISCIHLFYREPAGLWPVLVPARPRGEAAPTSADTPPPPDPTKDPAVAAAIQKAVAAAAAAHEVEKAAILANKEEILGEKKRIEAALGGKKPDEIAAALTELESIKLKAKAGEHGVDPDKYQADVEKAAQGKHQVWQQEQAQVLAKNQERITELEAANAQLKAAEHRSWCAYRIALAALPPDYRYIHEGAEEMVLDRVVPLMERYQPEGLPPVARFKVGGTLQTGSGPDGYMTEREFLGLAREGKLPGAPQLQYLFVSNGQGSNTQAPDATSAAGAGGNWWKMTDEGRTEYVKKHGKAAAQELIDRSPREKTAA